MDLLGYSGDPFGNLVRRTDELREVLRIPDVPGGMGVDEEPAGGGDEASPELVTNFILVKTNC